MVEFFALLSMAEFIKSLLACLEIIFQEVTQVETPVSMEFSTWSFMQSITDISNLPNSCNHYSFYTMGIFSTWLLQRLVTGFANLRSLDNSASMEKWRVQQSDSRPKCPCISPYKSLCVKYLLILAQIYSFINFAELTKVERQQTIVSYYTYQTTADMRTPTIINHKW